MIGRVRRVLPLRRPVPGEGIEPSRAEAHGCLRPARLPIPPSRPGRTSVPGIGALAILTTLLVACSGPGVAEDGPRIAFLFDGSWDETAEVIGPALAGLRFAALPTGDLEAIQPLNLGEPDGLELLREVAADPAVVAVVVAPWTAPHPDAVDALVDAGLPVVSLTWAWGPPAADTPWILLAPDLEGEAELLVAAGRRVAAPPRRGCVAGDTHPTSRPLTRATLAAAERTGTPVPDVGDVDPERETTASAVAARLAARGCGTVLWTGGAEALDLLFHAAPDLRRVVGASRVKTEGGIAVGVAHPGRRIVAACVCADIALTRDPDLQRFIHDFQSESGNPVGAFAVEAYDVGRWLLGLSDGGRTSVAGTVARAGGVDGLLGSYRLGPDGSLGSSPAPARSWRAFGSRWLPIGPELPLATALPLARVLARVAPEEAPSGAPGVHRSGEGP